MMACGPLEKLRVVEFAGLGPAPFCAMLLADLGADVIRVDRAQAPAVAPSEIALRGRRSIALDLKSPRDVETCARLIERADALIEGFRPGVMERLSLGPEAALKRNPKLVYGRMTGWGQTGPLAHTAAHDINYIAIAGVLGALGTSERPLIPMNLVGDLGGGALYLAMGLLAGVLHVRAGGAGQVVDCAMSDGSASLMTFVYSLFAQGRWHPDRGRNAMNGAAPFYNCYRCADGEWVALGAIEPHFWAVFVERSGLAPADFGDQYDSDSWPRQKALLEQHFLTRTRAEWVALFDGCDACFTPVLSLDEATRHAHNQARQSFVEAGGVAQPAPAPRFSLTPGRIQRPPASAGAHTSEILRDWGVT